MTDPRQSNDEFFGELSTLFASRQGKDHGSIFMTQKRLTDVKTLDASDAKPTKTLLQGTTITRPSEPVPILVRVTDGMPQQARAEAKKSGSEGKIKLSTVVQPQDLESFFARYAEICKAGMSALKKRDRSKRKKKAKSKGPGPVAS